MDTNANELVMQSMSMEIKELQERLSFFESVFSQLVMGLSEAGIIQIADPESEEEQGPANESSIIIP